ncbi:daptide-type RiPP biosynthesis dehydogenase [Saccharothrix sp. NPDC042600]|uniref:daptide-type RiPP biosynthesis dehydogenase n=1 Tax=Saccharothrix TaxID=2071 RepID=UPI0033F51348|nr:hypothetical protein GCM10017745_45490 [Saccharothrix mutabilis subsp. capreolus]
MITRWRVGTTVVHGSDAWEAVNSDGVLRGRVVLLLDAGFQYATRQSAPQLLDRVHAVAQPVAESAVDSTKANFDTVVELASWLAEQRPDTVVAVGGGRLLDLAKLAAAVVTEPSVRAVLRTGSARAGVVALPTPHGEPLRRVLVPTTVGTGSEVSAVACLDTPHGRRLVVGEHLRADTAVLDPDFTRSLPPHLVREGVLETLLRAVGPLVGSPEPSPVADVEALAVIGAATALGYRVASGDRAAPTRLLAAQLSALSHVGWCAAGRHPYAVKHWYIANELSTVAAVRKMVATACLLPNLWQRVLAGDQRFGDAGRLLVAWEAIRRAAPVPLGRDPGAGIRLLLDHWRITSRIPGTDAIAARVAARTVTAWGGRLPMLPDVTTHDIHALLTQCLDPGTSPGKEVVHDSNDGTPQAL